MTTQPATSDRFVWDDRLWELVWERHLDQVERHAIALDTWAGRVPKTDRFRARVVTELARRWRRRARNLAWLYGLWTAFWTAMVLRSFDFEPIVQTRSGVGLPASARDALHVPDATQIAATRQTLTGLAVVGAVAVLAALAVRWRLRVVARLRP